MHYTTLNRIRENHPCDNGWKKLLKSLGKAHADDEPLSLRHILDSNGLDDALWALRAIDDVPEIRLFAVRCARQIQHLMDDERSLLALDAAERYVIGEADDEELNAARAAAGAAVRDAAWAAGRAAGAAVRDAAWAAGRAARAAAWEAAGDAAEAAAWDAQKEDFIAIFCEEE